MQIEVKRFRTLSEVSNVDPSRIWDIYWDAFVKSRVKSVQDQLCYTSKTLAEALDDTDYVKFVACIDDNPVGFVLATNDLEKASVAYVNPGFLRAAFPQECSEGRLHYFTAIAIEQAHQGKRGLFYLLIEDITKYIDAADSLVCYDTSNETGKMVSMIIQQATVMAQKRNTGTLRTNHSETKVLGGQTYHVQRLSTRSDD